ncbi:hypothetical protein GHK52_09125, partial [Lactococcus garvieae]|nr:hypothetical protein [Lactococcus garvieae]
MINFTDEERVIIADKEYKKYSVGDEISVEDKKLGYVSEVINNKETGEQTYIITDGNPKT